MEIAAEPIEQALRGDRTAQEELGAWCLQYAFRLAYVDLGDVPNRAALAEEIAGEVSLKAITNLDRFQPGTRFDFWLHQIMRNCIRDHFRREDRGIPHAVYQRWVHDFIATYRPELEALIQRECGQEPSGPHQALVERITKDLRDKTYSQFIRHVWYEGSASTVLNCAKRWLKSFVGLEWVPLYEHDEEGEWVEAALLDEEAIDAELMQQELVQQVNEHLAGLQPICRRFIRWYYLDRLRMPEIARLEGMSERTAWRRLESCSATFRARLSASGYFKEWERGNADE
jgi:RNA polymerase sigma factor (sigma-70 family)